MFVIKINKGQTANQGSLNTYKYIQHSKIKTFYDTKMQASKMYNDKQLHRLQQKQVIATDSKTLLKRT